MPRIPAPTLPAQVLAAATVVLALAAAPAWGLEYPIGKPQHQAGMEVAAVYLQPVDMESGMPMRKLAGPGKYRVRYTIDAPNARGNAAGQHFGRHTDRAAGVGPWFEPFSVEWEFTYAGVGKKGGY